MPPDDDAGAGRKRARPERRAGRPLPETPRAGRAPRARTPRPSAGDQPQKDASAFPPPEPGSASSTLPDPTIDFERLTRDLLAAFKAKAGFKTRSSRQPARAGASVVDHIHDFIVQVCERYQSSFAVIPSHDDLVAEGKQVVRRRLNAAKQCETDREQIVNRRTPPAPAVSWDIADQFGSDEEFRALVLALYDELKRDTDAIDLLGFILHSDFEPHENRMFAVVLGWKSAEDVANKKRKIKRVLRKLIAKPPFNSIYRRKTEQ